MSTQFEYFGKYVLLEKLATGGMAEVFLARGSGAGGIGKFFAIKRILPQYADSPEFIDMFKEEAKIAINLSHSNIVSIHEFGVEKGQFFLVMDYVEGRNLRQILNKMKKSGLQFSIDQIIYIVKEVANGLDHAHRCIDSTTGKPLNITHRDMSPQNVMVSFEGETKIVDFGIAKAESQIETTRAGTLKGKFGYMSPEQAEGQPVDLRTDIFSLGIVLWELLAHDRLFVANNEINTLRKIRDCQIPSLRKINPNIHTELERIVQKALARDRNLRYQTGAALHRDLNRFLNRQYPDFSPQDFAVFIKSVFADEILSTRKRLLEYAKLNIGQQPPSNFDDRTSLLDTSTNSLVVSDSQSSFSIPGKVNQTPTPADDSAKPVVGGPTPKTHQMAAQAQAEAEAQAQNQPDSASSVPGLSDPSIEVRQATRNAVPSANTLPPARSSVGTASTSLVFDDKAINTLETDVARIKNNLETEDIDDDMGGRWGTRKTNVRYNNRVVPSPQIKKKPHSPVRFATFFVFALMVTSVYAYLVKYFTPMMSEVIAVTDPYLHGFHSALGVDIHATISASHEPRLPAGQTERPAPMPAPPAPAAVPTPGPAPAPAPENETFAVLVISNPSGADILLNGKPTGLITPSRVEVPAQGNFTMTLRKHGFAEFRTGETNKDRIGNRWTANLTKTNVAYLDIDVFPPQEATVYVNGKAITGRAPIRELPVMANVPIRVRAETKSGGGFDEITVNLPVDRRESIQLNPRKSIRLPSNAPGEQ